MTTDEFERLKDQILSRDEIMRLFNVSNVTVWQWVKTGKLREHKFNRTPFYLRDEVLEDVKNNGVKHRSIV